MGEEQPGKPKVVVTGASGLVGSNLVEFLVKRNFSVVALVRSPNSAEHLIEFANKVRDIADLQLKQANVTDSAALRQAFEGADVVVHCAGSVDPYGARQAVFETNLGGSRNAVAAAKLAKVKQFIHISSLSVITGQGDQFNVDENAPLKPCGEAYADSKIEAEKAVMAECAHISVTTLRPGFIYGPRERAWLPRLIANIRDGKAMLIDGGKRETNVIYVGNLCRAIEGSILNARAFNQVFNLTDGQHITKKQLFDAISDGLNLPRVERSVPRPVAWVACEIVSSFAPMLSAPSRQKLSRFSRAAFRLAAINQGFDITKAERDLGYANRIPFSEGMARTLEFFKTVPAGQIGEPSEGSGLSAARRG